MKNKFYMKEFQYHDGESFVTFNIVDVNMPKNEICVAVTKQGKISVVTYSSATSTAMRNTPRSSSRPSSSWASPWVDGSYWK